jgi:uncharacterized membrane protein YphA (DoxX/SURF4 family)
VYTTEARSTGPRAWAVVGVVARLIVGGVWVAAGLLKIPDPAENVRAVRAYQLLPESVVPTVGYALPIVEVVVGACLILGLLTRVNGVLSCLLLVAFIVGIASAWARGLQIDCGCFGVAAGRPRTPARSTRGSWHGTLVSSFFAAGWFGGLGHRGRWTIVSCPDEPRGSTT